MRWLSVAAAVDASDEAGENGGSVRHALNLLAASDPIQKKLVRSF